MATQEPTEHASHTEAPESVDNRWRLSSAAASDMKWYFRCAGAELGLSASRFEMPAETVRTVAVYECRACHERVAAKFGDKCKCGATIVDFGLIEVHGSRGGASKRSTEKPDRQIAAVPKERRIRLGLWQLDATTRHALEAAYTCRQHTPEMRRVLGEFADLVMRLERCQSAFNRYADHGGTLDYETWLTKRCGAHGQRPDSSLVKMREEVERSLGDALAAYQKVRIRPSEEERYGQERAVEKPQRKSPLERVRAILSKMRATEVVR